MKGRYCPIRVCLSRTSARRPRPMSGCGVVCGCESLLASLPRGGGAAAAARLVGAHAGPGCPGGGAVASCDDVRCRLALRSRASACAMRSDKGTTSCTWGQTAVKLQREGVVSHQWLHRWSQRQWGEDDGDAPKTIHRRLTQHGHSPRQCLRHAGSGEEDVAAPQTSHRCYTQWCHNRVIILHACLACHLCMHLAYQLVFVMLVCGRQRGCGCGRMGAYVCACARMCLHISPRLSQN